MRMRTIVTVAAIGMLLAGCTPAARAVDGPVVIPQEIAWQYVSSCVELAPDGVLLTSLSWSNAGGDVGLQAPDDPGLDLTGVESAIEECLEAHRYEQSSGLGPSLSQRAELYEYYRGKTLPCLAGEGVDVDPVPRDIFLQADVSEPWNPYLAMDLPFERLLELYQACPPRPAFLDGGAAG